MRISRTNFYPILETEGENDESASYYSYENNELPEEAVEAPVMTVAMPSSTSPAKPGIRTRPTPAPIMV